MASGAFRRLKSPYVSWRSRMEARLPLLPPALPERLRGGRVERLLDYWKSVAGDYAESVQQMINARTSLTSCQSLQKAQKSS